MKKILISTSICILSFVAFGGHVQFIAPPLKVKEPFSYFDFVKKYTKGLETANSIQLNLKYFDNSFKTQKRMVEIYTESSSHYLKLAKQIDQEIKLMQEKYRYVCPQLINDFEDTKIIFTTIPYPFDGRTFLRVPVINLYKIIDYSENRVFNLAIHELIHSLSLQINIPHTVVGAIYLEGMATFVANEISGFSIDEFLEVEQKQIKLALDKLCEVNWKEDFDGLVSELFDGSDYEFKVPRMGYFIGQSLFLKLLEEKDQKEWCQIEFSDFQDYYHQNIDSFQQQICGEMK